MAPTVSRLPPLAGIRVREKAAEADARTLRTQGNRGEQTDVLRLAPRHPKELWVQSGPMPPPGSQPGQAVIGCYKATVPQDWVPLLVSQSLEPWVGQKPCVL